jgi:hypothetical protein
MHRFENNRAATRRLAVVAIALLAALTLASGALAAGPPTVGLGTADNYGVLAGDTITNTGATTINGDLGLFPGTAVTGAPTVVGASNVNNGAAQQAKADLRTAYLDAAGRTGPILVAGGALGSRTLAPGLYKDDGAPASLGIAGGQTLTLQGGADDVWIFQSSSTLAAEVSSRVILVGGARSCNVFWQVATSATLKTSSTFVGTIMAQQHIAVQNSVTVAGRLLAGAQANGAGALTLDTDTITKTHCASAAEVAAAAAEAARLEAERAATAAAALAVEAAKTAAVAKAATAAKAAAKVKATAAKAAKAAKVAKVAAAKASAAAARAATSARAAAKRAAAAKPRPALTRARFTG